MTLHTYNPQPISLPSINFLHLTVSEILSGQDFICGGHYGKVKGQIKVTPLRCTPTPNQCPYHVSTSYTLQFPRYILNKVLKVKVITARPKVKSRSHHDVAHLHTLTNVPTTSYTYKLFPATRLPISTPWVKTIPRQPLRAVG